MMSLVTDFFPYFRVEGTEVPCYLTYMVHHVVSTNPILDFGVGTSLKRGGQRIKGMREFPKKKEKDFR